MILEPRHWYFKQRYPSKSAN